MLHLTFAQWSAAILAAVGVGISKAGFSGFSLLHVLIFAWLFGARGSTGVVLPMLIFGDLSAVRTFHAHAQWTYIRRMLPPACLGVIAAAMLMSRLSEAAYKPIMGWIILALAALHLLRTARPSWFGAMPHSRAFSWGMGLAAGTMTMMANAAGPIFSLYALAIDLPKFELVGTGAWFFFIINLFKVPFSAGLGLIDGSSLLLDAALVAFVVPGALLGKWAVHRINQRLFERLVIAATVVGGIQLLLR